MENIDLISFEDEPVSGEKEIQDFLSPLNSTKETDKITLSSSTLLKKEVSETSKKSKVPNLVKEDIKDVNELFAHFWKDKTFDAPLETSVTGTKEEVSAHLNKGITSEQLNQHLEKVLTNFGAYDTSVLGKGSATGRLKNADGESESSSCTIDALSDTLSNVSVSETKKLNTFLCKECNNPIDIVDNDLQNSLLIHNKSFMHISATDSKDSYKKNALNILYKCDNGEYICVLCNVRFPVNQMLNHCQIKMHRDKLEARNAKLSEQRQLPATGKLDTSLHKKKPIQTNLVPGPSFETDKNVEHTNLFGMTYIQPGRGNTLKCTICKTRLSASNDLKKQMINISVHINGKKHSGSLNLLEKNLNAPKGVQTVSNSHQAEININTKPPRIRQRSSKNKPYIMLCLVCEVSLSGRNTCKTHLNTSVHSEKLNSLILEDRNQLVKFVEPNEICIKCNAVVVGPVALFELHKRICTGSIDNLSCENSCKEKIVSNSCVTRTSKKKTSNNSFNLQTIPSYADQNQQAAKIPSLMDVNVPNKFGYVNDSNLNPENAKYSRRNVYLQNTSSYNKQELGQSKHFTPGSGNNSFHNSMDNLSSAPCNKQNSINPNEYCGEHYKMFLKNSIPSQNIPTHFPPSRSEYENQQMQNINNVVTRNQSQSKQTPVEKTQNVSSTENGCPVS